MKSKAEARYKKRLPCLLRLGERHYAGLILNVSRGGLFVQTSAAPQRGETVEVRLSERGETDKPALATEVIWQRQVPSQLRNIAKGGLGLQIRYAPESYYDILLAAESSASSRGSEA